MSKLVKEIAGLCYSLDKLYYSEKDPKQKKDVEKNFKILSRLLSKAIKHQFDENDLLYKEDVKKIRKINRNIKKRKNGLYKFERLISNIIKITDQLDFILTKD